MRTSTAVSMFTTVVAPMLPSIVISAPSVAAAVYGDKNGETSTAHDQQERNDN